MVGIATAFGFLGTSADVGKAVGHATAEVGQEFADLGLGLGPAQVIVVASANGQSLIVAAEVLGVVFFQRVDAVQSVAAAMQDQRREQAGSASVTVVAGGAVR